MNEKTLLVGIIILATLTVGILYVIFGQVTVRRLRKDISTKEALGMEAASGWDILNVAQALALPDSFVNKLEKSSISYLYAKASILKENTSKLDRFLAIIFYYSWILTAIFTIVIVGLNAFGFFD